MRKIKKIEASKVEPFVNGAADEIRAFALAHTKGYEGSAVDDAESDLEMDVEDALTKLPSARISRARRAVLIRVAAGSIALLAIDEAKRGQRAVARDMRQIDEHGFVKR